MSSIGVAAVTKCVVNGQTETPNVTCKPTKDFLKYKETHTRTHMHASYIRAHTHTAHSQITKVMHSIWSDTDRHKMETWTLTDTHTMIPKNDAL